MENYLWIKLVWYGFGVVVGTIATLLFLKKPTVGSIGLDTSDPNEEPLIFLDLTKGLNYIFRQKYVLFKIKTRK